MCRVFKDLDYLSYEKFFQLSHFVLKEMAELAYNRETSEAAISFAPLSLELIYLHIGDYVEQKGGVKAVTWSSAIKFARSAKYDDASTFIGLLDYGYSIDPNLPHKIVASKLAKLLDFGK